MSRAKPNLSPAEFTEWSGLSVSTVRRRIKDGTIDSEQPGGFGTRIFIPMDAFQRVRADDCLHDDSDGFGKSDDTGENTRQADSISGPRPKWMTEN